MTDKKRILLFYRREGAAAWLAHLDTMRLFERALSRADWPLSWTVDAFNPRPELVFALPVGVGIETRRDPVGLTLADGNQAFDLEEAVDRLNRSFPKDIRVVDYQEEPATGKGSLMARVKAARYLLEAPGLGLAFDRTFSGGEPVVMTRQQKKKKVTVDLTPRLFAWQVGKSDQVTLTAGAGSTGHLRIDLLLDSLVQFWGLDPSAARGSRVVRLEVILDRIDPAQGIIV